MGAQSVTQSVTQSEGARRARARGVAWSAPSPSALHLISDVSPAVRRQLCKAVTWCVKFRFETSLCQTVS